MFGLGLLSKILQFSISWAAEVLRCHMPKKPGIKVKGPQNDHWSLIGNMVRAKNWMRWGETCVAVGVLFGDHGFCRGEHFSGVSPIVFGQKNSIFGHFPDRYDRISWLGR